MRRLYERGFPRARGFRRNVVGHALGMSAWLLLSIPGTPLLLGAVLLLSAQAEAHFLSPRSLILSATRARWNTPEYAEAMVAREVERLLQGRGSASP